LIFFTPLLNKQAVSKNNSMVVSIWSACGCGSRSRGTAGKEASKKGSEAKTLLEERQGGVGSCCFRNSEY